jgi:hypothetical protein
VNLYSVDYGVKDVEAYKANPPPLPKVVLASTLDNAYAIGKSFETDNLVLREVKVEQDNARVAIEAGYAGVVPAAPTDPNAAPAAPSVPTGTGETNG